jgi:hypothetical protein
MNAEFVASLREEMRAMIAKAIAENPYRFIIVAIEDDEEAAANRRDHEPQSSND